MAYPKSETQDLKLRAHLMSETRDLRPGTLQVVLHTQDQWLLLYMGPGTQDPKQTSLVEPGTRTDDPNELIQMKQDLNNKFFHVKLYYQTTVGYVVNKFFFYCTKFDLYIPKTYSTFLENICTHLHAYSILTSNHFLLGLFHCKT